jgi:molecular chaperone DnaJ
MKKDLYAELGVAKDATQEEIRRAYRRKAAKLHPDNPDTGDREKFESVALAHTILTDESKRNMYDQTGFVPGEDREPIEALQLIFSLRK